jgi:O-antigen/teichoic acid export membrane protein
VDRVEDPPAGRFDASAARRSAEARGETLDQLLDRNLAELLQELRVAITGVQVLFAFLLGLAFTARFEELDGFGVAVYTVTLLATALATVLLIAPVSFHRLVFRRRQKGALIRVGDVLLRLGLAMLVVAISCGTLLVLDVVLGRGAAVAGGGLVLLTGAVTWYALPLWARRPGRPGFPARPADTASDDAPREDPR